MLECRILLPSNFRHNTWRSTSLQLLPNLVTFGTVIMHGISFFKAWTLSHPHKTFGFWLHTGLALPKPIPSFFAMVLLQSAILMNDLQTAPGEEPELNPEAEIKKDRYDVFFWTGDVVDHHRVKKAASDASLPLRHHLSSSTGSCVLSVDESWDSVYFNTYGSMMSLFERVLTNA